jgi:hypothetical protein
MLARDAPNKIMHMFWPSNRNFCQRILTIRHSRFLRQECSCRHIRHSWLVKFNHEPKSLLGLPFFNRLISCIATTNNAEIDTIAYWNDKLTWMKGVTEGVGKPSTKVVFKGARGWAGSDFLWMWKKSTTSRFRKFRSPTWVSEQSSLSSSLIKDEWWREKILSVLYGTFYVVLSYIEIRWDWVRGGSTNLSIEWWAKRFKLVASHHHPMQLCYDVKSAQSEAKRYVVYGVGSMAIV